MNRFALAVLAATFVFTMTITPKADAQRYQRRVVQQRSYRGVPIMQRPNRRGHIVGNTLRLFAR